MTAAGLAFYGSDENLAVSRGHALWISNITRWTSGNGTRTYCQFAAVLKWDDDDEDARLNRTVRLYGRVTYVAISNMSLPRYRAKHFQRARIA
jgi:hypothetical protein